MADESVLNVLLRPVKQSTCRTIQTHFSAPPANIASDFPPILFQHTLIHAQLKCEHVKCAVKTCSHDAGCCGVAYVYNRVMIVSGIKLVVAGGVRDHLSKIVELIIIKTTTSTQQQTVRHTHTHICGVHQRVIKVD